MSFLVWAWVQDEEPSVLVEGGSPGPGWVRLGHLSRESDPKLYEAIRRELRLDEGERSADVTGVIAGVPAPVLVANDTNAIDLHLALGPLDPDGGYLHTVCPARLEVPELSPSTAYVSPSSSIPVQIEFRRHGHRHFFLNGQ